MSLIQDMDRGILDDNKPAPSTARDGVKSEQAVILSDVIDKVTQGVSSKTRCRCIGFIGHFQFASKPAANIITIKSYFSSDRDFSKKAKIRGMT
jgi:hypothetical protein